MAAVSTTMPRMVKAGGNASARSPAAPSSAMQRADVRLREAFVNSAAKNTITM